MERKMSQCVFSDKFYAENIHLSLGGNTSFAIRPQFPGSQKQVCLYYQRCAKTLLRHSIPFLEKKY